MLAVLADQFGPAFDSEWCECQPTSHRSTLELPLPAARTRPSGLNALTDSIQPVLYSLTMLGKVNGRRTQKNRHVSLIPLRCRVHRTSKDIHEHTLRHLNIAPAGLQRLNAGVCVHYSHEGMGARPTGLSSDASLFPARSRPSRRRAAPLRVQSASGRLTRSMRPT